MKMWMRLLSVIMIAASVVVVGHWVEARPAKSPCDGGQCIVPAPVVPGAKPAPAPSGCDNQCATCPDMTCPENPAYEGDQVEGHRGVIKGVGKAAVKPLRFLNRVRPKLLRPNRCSR
jgi:hypothetical protein